LPLDCNFAGSSHPVLDRHLGLVGEVSALGSIAVGIQTLSAEVSALNTKIGQKLNLNLNPNLNPNLNLNPNDPVLEQLSTDFSEIRKEISTVRVEIAAMSPIVTSSESCSYFVQIF
jgi:hypothetical protein